MPSSEFLLEYTVLIGTHFSVMTEPFTPDISNLCYIIMMPSPKLSYEAFTGHQCIIKQTSSRLY